MYPHLQRRKWLYTGYRPAQNGAALSVSTPSNAKDTTATGGTVTPVSQTKILSWSWFDPEENLLDGRLELTGITEEAQPSFTEIIEYLPTAIIAQVGEGEDREEKNLLITNWSCPEYVQDEEGRWPLESTYEFKAELPEGYELAEGVDALVVEVSVAGDQAAVTANELPVLRVSPTPGQEPRTLNFDGVRFSSLNGVFDRIKEQTNIQVEYLGTGTDGQYQFRLILNDTSASNIIIPNGDWEIVLKGNNQLDGKGTTCGGIGLYIIGGGTHATIVAGTGNASLTANGNQTSGRGDGSCGIKVEANLTVQSGNVVAVMEATGEFNDASGAICVTQNGTLNINGGSVTAIGKGKYGLYATGTVNMSDGNFEITGENKIAVDHEPNSNFTLAGGTINIKSLTGHTGLSTKGNLTITGGKMDVNILEIVKDTTMTVERGILETGGIKIGDNGRLINKGELIANGNFEGNGTIENTGTISGSGNVPEGNRTDPGKITFTQPAEVPYDGSILNVKNLAKIEKPKNAGALTYEILSKSTGKGTIDTNGRLTVEKIGTFVIQVTTEGTGVYKPAKSVEITLKVTPGTFPTGWDLKVEAAKGVYNGAKGYPAATITTTNIPADAKYEYQLAATLDSKQLSNQWLSECPKIINVTFDQYVFVKVITDNYESKVFRSKDPINIERREFTKDNVAVTVNPQTVVYNGKVRNSEIKVEVFENWSGSSGNKVDSADYTILGWTDRDGNPVKELKDAGTYIVRLMGAKRNYWEGVMDASFTIEKCKLKSQMTGGPVDKVYDGTTDITEEQGVFVELWNDSGVPDLQDIHADQVKYAYRSADVGEHYIDATIITLAGDKVNNYELINETSSLKGVIKPRDFASMTVSAAPLTYNGTEQQPKINVSMETGLENVSPDATFTYSKDGVNYQSEIPSFTEAGTYLVYVKASMANFNDETKTVAVTVQKAAAPTVSAMSESYSYKETGERQVALPGFPENCGTIGSITAQIVSDEGQILDSAAVDGMNLVLRLKGSSKNMVGKTAQVVVKVETKNYEDIQIPVIVTLTADSSDSNSNNNSGNNSGNNGTNNGNSNGSSSSDGDSSDYDDPNESSVKVTPDPSNKVTKDSQKGYRNVEQGVITGASNQTVNDGYSHWMKDAKGWWLRYSDGTWPMGRAGAYHWEKINGRWWAFDETGYAKTGWLRDEDYGGWFYMDPEHGMQTGWMLLNGVWYYFNPISDGKRGIMYAGQRTPDGYYVDKNGVWDGRSKQ